MSLGYVENISIGMDAYLLQIQPRRTLVDMNLDNGTGSSFKKKIIKKI